MIPKAGGEYEYLMVSFGNLPGFLFIWTFIIIMIPASFALTALTFADYVLQPFYLTCDPPLSARLLLGAASISITQSLIINLHLNINCIFHSQVIITLINCVSVRLTNIVQNVCTIGKIAGLLMIIGLGVYSLFLGI